MELHGLHGQVVERIGESLAAQEIRAGQVLRLEDVQDRYGVSRTVAREAVRVLESKRIVTSRPRVGITVRPMAEWNLYDPQVIRWRLASPFRSAQLRELTELRAAVEPCAAALAAVGASPDTRNTLVELARTMESIAHTDDTQGFIAADLAFHRALLNASGNGMFAQLSEVTEELLVARRDLPLMPDHVDTDAVRRHTEVAEAIAEGRPDDAAQCVRAIVDSAHREVEQLLEGGAHCALSSRPMPERGDAT
ncbi:FCD domain-containing protein [Streptomyces sp. NBC_01221]|uniref:FadR/GntR family transcriptional regulator n=1 Tax=unclassified Streptomyces TaxID=2593676 RepID=UPI0022519A59|nr:MULTISPECIES: FCD domain-containing protein [unclassified Streptomyces]MCX4791655.1 FCD domain-containing protein [Streptomyces sp. NBC_01221]MCX4792720.1 FCD domain-containing protein [Streptomyces sp. NBC_01242]WSP59768.1 FCD domain-containing protein [Streptomyces sp. NBC_01241]WSU19716.1 FCD domain-containing protein [Streptomyces sp. NBC_01108]